MKPPRIHPAWFRARVAWLLAACMLLQSLVVLRHELAMSAGFEVCSASGAKRVGGWGGPDPSSAPADGSHLLHACCVLADAAAPPPAAWPVPSRAVARPPRALAQPAGRLSMVWSAPLSRGPPRFV